MDSENRSSEMLLLDNQLCFSLYAASRKVIQAYAPLLEKIDLTYTQYITLLVLWEHPSLPVKELGNYLMLDTGTLTPLLKRLEKKGFVTRTRSTKDERSVIIAATEKGRAIRQEALDFLPSLLCSSCMTPQELIELRELVKRLVEGLNHQPD
jgi:MarR family transcriptional regulator, organic hydroperoxide resistance regulator